jgi:hypothetical protein
MKSIETRTWLTVAVLVFVCAMMPARGEEGTAPRLTIEQAVIARQVEEREPVGEGTIFPSDVGQVACYTKVIGATGETFIEHVWSQGEVERARVHLAVRSADWRTWSTKRINPAWTGDWTVRIEDAEGRVLDRLTFTIGEGAREGSN